MKIVNKFCSGIEWNIDDEDITESNKKNLAALQLDTDPMYGILYKELLSTYPDFTWRTSCWFDHNRQLDKSTAEFTGVYKCLNGYYDEGIFTIRFTLRRDLGEYWNKSGNKTGGNHYEIKMECHRDGHELPQVAEKIKAKYDGHAQWGSWYKDYGERVFVAVQQYEGDKCVAAENKDLTNWIKVACKYRVNLASKFVEADKKARKQYAASQSNFDIETMEYPTRLGEIVKKYYLGEIEVENDIDIRKFRVKVGRGAYIVVSCSGKKATLGFDTNNYTSSCFTASDAAVYVLRLIKHRFNNATTLTDERAQIEIPLECALGDEYIFKIFEAACKAYSNLYYAYTCTDEPLKDLFKTKV